MEEKDEMLDEFEYSAEAAERKTEVKIVHNDDYIYAFIKAFNRSNK